MLTCALTTLNFGLTANAESNNQPAPELLAYPGVVALSESSPGEWTYKKFPGLGRLYISDRDTPGKSYCVNNCALAWPPLLAKDTDKPMGQWTIIERDSGAKQWAYKGNPAYTRFHDSPTQPSGNGVDGFSFLEP
ncbi:MAG TPA: hypothetical protein DGZ24_04610 [Rhodospirillaceae bacterium]|nr:hypothetical protein [Candidatus Neomarinimicrobiota bacterium]HCX14579.1 hypothetical protein [Rhodospirillaceae bacterium]